MDGWMDGCIQMGWAQVGLVGLGGFKRMFMVMVRFWWMQGHVDTYSLREYKLEQMDMIMGQWVQVGLGGCKWILVVVAGCGWVLIAGGCSWIWVGIGGWKWIQVDMGYGQGLLQMSIALFWLVLANFDEFRWASIIIGQFK